MNDLPEVGFISETGWKVQKHHTLMGSETCMWVHACPHCGEPNVQVLNRDYPPTSREGIEIGHTDPFQCIEYLRERFNYEISKLLDTF